ncbi:hypothetical protein SmJEL517_g05914 [Synchytrium microbalum]|uniref:Dienelactone hydrolase domain-containing protein n=1 Tax=Synchytrium microbalum TaxID=1806994 RepID=A0A507BII2_9FUNG|nr:uncharacterized protein SmJEL517_g05914 [Synchytrium microbalum]TPX30530.1 hypothetical protein SmJEL517_g05914 [Synchytrium microbalum]
MSSTYEPVGTVSAIDGMQCYSVGHSSRVIIAAYDIFGFNIKQTRQALDTLANQGFKVIMPDFFRGATWDHGADFSQLMPWIQKHGSWDVCKADVKMIIDHVLASDPSAKIGMLGFCWGGWIGMQAASDPTYKLSSWASVHPSLLTAEGVAKTLSPACLLPSKDEPDYGAIYEALSKKPFAAANRFQRFEDCVHGWCAARADYSDALNAARTSEALGIFAGFFASTLAPGAKL